MTKRQDYWGSETFPLVENRHKIGIIRFGKSPYHATVSHTEALRLEKLARAEAPPRHCLCCGRVLVKRVRVKTEPNQDVVLSSVEYGYTGTGYWCTIKCLRKSAPKMVAGLIRIKDRWPRTRGDRSEVERIAIKTLNHHHHHFD